MTYEESNYPNDPDEFDSDSYRGAGWLALLIAVGSIIFVAAVGMSADWLWHNIHIGLAGTPR